jgi:hypothetical protein
VIVSIPSPAPVIPPTAVPSRVGSTWPPIKPRVRLLSEVDSVVFCSAALPCDWFYGTGGLRSILDVLICS